MPLAQKPHRPKADVELLRRERIAFETAEDLLRNAVGMQTTETKIADLVQSEETNFEVPGSVLVSFRNIPAAAKSLADDWVTWEPQQRLRRSSFVKVTGRLETHLHPYYLSRLGLGLRGAAGFLLHRWSEPLRCIPLGFVELKPASSYAAVVAESPYVHFLMRFVAVGFAPEKGDWVVGQVSEVQVQAGMNVTLLGLMNCHVRAWDLPQDLRYCPVTSRWLDVRNGKADREDGSVRGKPLTQVWLKLEEDTVVDHFNVSGQHFEFRCTLGWPPEEVPQLLEKARAEEAAALEAKRNGKAAASKAAAGAKIKAKRAREPAEASTPLKKVKKEPVAEEPSSSKKRRRTEEPEGGELTEPSSSKKPKKSPAKAKELDEGEPGESASSKKPKKSLGSLKEVKKEPEESASPKKPKKSPGKLQEVKEELAESASSKKPKKSPAKLQENGEAPLSAKKSQSAAAHGKGEEQRQPKQDNSAKVRQVLGDRKLPPGGHIYLNKASQVWYATDPSADTRKTLPGSMASVSKYGSDEAAIEHAYAKLCEHQEAAPAARADKTTKAARRKSS